jgi:hypothetical protein
MSIPSKVSTRRLSKRTAIRQNGGLTRSSTSAMQTAGVYGSIRVQHPRFPVLRHRSRAPQSCFLAQPAAASQTDRQTSPTSGSATRPSNPFFDEAWFLTATAICLPANDNLQSRPLANASPGDYLPPSRQLDANLQNTRKAYLAHLGARAHLQKILLSIGLRTFVGVERRNRRYEEQFSRGQWP